ncbi:hypothetical protein CUJ83_08530 [Methanocella sp. CWC-04]|uniref:Oxidoreductase molybdopterin-binding domain-containing protein n=1 Tax=Methanooceanicella nereidis TaxID=2052831 RepID=A0AAP2RE03_9EURY|nr:molybdopterin-dependent oxidoreductase [Methanocella sp. CWC-04]MCD1295041.1 hypothetical protein [Methanocella sp. CWC-04]
MKLNGKSILLLITMVAFIVAISGCTQPTATPAATPTPEPGPVVLTVKGNVDNQLDLTMADLNAYGTKTISVEGKDGVMMTYTGVSYSKLLEDAKLKGGAASATMIGADGYSKSLPIANITASQDAIIAIEEDKTLKAVIPGESKGAWVGGLVTIEIE